MDSTRGISIGADRRAESRLEDAYRLHAPGLRRLAYLLCGDEEVARDLCHDAFARLYTRFGTLRSPRSIRPYLTRTLCNLVRSHFRRRRIERRYLHREATRTYVVEATVAVDDALWRALMALPVRQRTAVLLRYYEDLSEEQTAELLGTSIASVKGLVARARDTLRSQLGGETRE